MYTTGESGLRFPHNGDCICKKCLKILMSDNMSEELIHLIGTGYESKK